MASSIQVVGPTTNHNGISDGIFNDSTADSLRRFLPPGYRNRKAWEAFIAALAAGDDYVRTTVQNAFYQLFLSSASGTYLIERAQDQGVLYPSAAGLSDDSFRQLAILLANNRIIAHALSGILEVFYGYDSTHANLVSAPETYSFRDGDTLQITVDDRDSVAITFQNADFADIGSATAVEVAGVITRAFVDAGLNAFAVAKTVNGVNVVVVYSGAIGLLGSLTVTGGFANYSLQFATPNPFVATGSPFTITLASPTEFRFIWANGAAPGNLNTVRVGDYVCLNLSSNSSLRGWYPVTSVVINANTSTGLYTNLSWFSIAPTPSFPYTTVGGPNTAQGWNPNEIIFFRPTRVTVVDSSNPAYIAQYDPNGGLDVVLPTTAVVSRDIDAAAYLNNTNAASANGPYSYDPNGFAVTATQTSTNAVLAGGRGVSVLPVLSTAGFPAGESWIVIGFGTQYSAGPIKCLGPLDNVNLAIDRSFVFSQQIPTATSVILLASKGAYQPSDGTNSFALTDSSAGRIAAQSFIDETVASGVQANDIIEYPGDRGLGGEGYPVTGLKVADKVGIWAGDDMDAALEAAHNA